MRQDIIKAIEYNIMNDNSVMLYLNKLILNDCSSIDVLFYKIILKYINPFYLHLFYQDMIDICNKDFSYRQLANSLCYIDKTVLSNDFRFINKLIKHKGSNRNLFNKFYYEMDYKCIMYYNVSEMISFFSNFKSDIYIILLWLYEIYKDKIFISYMLYIHISRLKTEQSLIDNGETCIDIDFDLEYNIEKKIEDKIKRIRITSVEIDYNKRLAYYEKIKDI